MNVIFIQEVQEAYLKHIKEVPAVRKYILSKYPVYTMFIKNNLYIIYKDLDKTFHELIKRVYDQTWSIYYDFNKQQQDKRNSKEGSLFLEKQYLKLALCFPIPIQHFIMKWIPTHEDAKFLINKQIGIAYNVAFQKEIMLFLKIYHMIYQAYPNECYEGDVFYHDYMQYLSKCVFFKPHQTAPKEIIEGEIWSLRYKLRDNCISYFPYVEPICYKTWKSNEAPRKKCWYAQELITDDFFINDNLFKLDDIMDSYYSSLDQSARKTYYEALIKEENKTAAKIAFGKYGNRYISETIIEYKYHGINLFFSLRNTSRYVAIYEDVDGNYMIDKHPLFQNGEVFRSPYLRDIYFHELKNIRKLKRIHKKKEDYYDKYIAPYKDH